MGKSYDPVRVGAPDHLVAEVDGLTGRRYKATGGGMYEMHPRDAAALVRAGGFRPGVGLGASGGGYRCDCGFRPVVRTCSRCGGRALTAQELAERERIGNLTIEVADAVTGRTLGSHRVADLVENVLTVVAGGHPKAAPIATRPQDWAQPTRSILFGGA